MIPKALKRIVQVPTVERSAIIAEGMSLLAEHVSVLSDDAERLALAGGTRGARVIDSFIVEAVGSYLILADLARAGWKDSELVGEQATRFYDHLARAVYVDSTAARPATLGELRAYVGTLRPQFYLDGPEDTNWIFRNDLLAEREEVLYVDYVHYDDGFRTWTTPKRLEDWPRSRNSAVKLVLALDRSGLSTKRGVEIAAACWDGIDIGNDSLAWNQVRLCNRTVLDDLEAEGLHLDSWSEADRHRVLRRWTFPMNRIAVREERIAVGELEARRRLRLSER